MKIGQPVGPSDCKLTGDEIAWDLAPASWPKSDELLALTDGCLRRQLLVV